MNDLKPDFNDTAALHRRLDEFRQIGDDLSDRAADLLFDNGYRRSDDSLAMLRRLAAEGHRAAHDFLAAVDDVPAWVDYDRIENGRLVYLRYAPLATLVVFLAGLIGSYSAAKGVKVLVRTGRLESDILPRLVETSQMICDVLQSGALRPGGQGLDTLARVRLMHSGVRRFISKDPGWNADWGHPVNQEDMCGTLTLFSYVIVKGLEKMGLYIPPGDREDYIHLWRYAGYVLGVNSFFIPPDYASTEKIYEVVRQRQCHPDDDSRRLVHKVIDAVYRSIPVYGQAEPPAAVRDMFYEMSAFFIGDELAASLQMPRNSLMSLGLKASVPFWQLFSRLTTASRLYYNVFSPDLGNRFMQARQEHGLKVRTAFPVPG